MKVILLLISSVCYRYVQFSLNFFQVDGLAYCFNGSKKFEFFFLIPGFLCCNFASIVLYKKEKCCTGSRSVEYG